MLYAVYGSTTDPANLRRVAIYADKEASEPVTEFLIEDPLAPTPKDTRILISGEFYDLTRQN